MRQVLTQQLLRSHAGANQWEFLSSQKNIFNVNKTLTRSIVTLQTNVPDNGCSSCGKFTLMKLQPELSFAIALRKSKFFSHSVRTFSSQGHATLFSEYKPYNVPEAITPTKSVTSSVLGTGKRWEDRRDNPLSKKLVTAKTVDEILAVLEEEAEMFDPISTFVAVDSLFDAMRSGPPLTIRSKHQILTSVGIQKLCKLLRRHGPHTDPGDLLNGIKILSFLCVPGNHQTFQILLKLISKHANFMDLQQVVYLHFLLDKLPSDSKSSLSNALEFALPVVFESKLTTQLDPNDSQGMCDYLHYATKYKISEQSIKFLVESILRSGTRDRLSSKHVLSIVWSLTDAPTTDSNHEPLMTWCLNRLADSSDDLKLSEISTTVTKLAKKYGNSDRANYFYHEDFLNTFCERIVQSDAEQEITVWAIKNISFLRHVNIELVDRVGEIIAADPSIILNSDHLYNVVIRSFANLNYKPEKWAAFSPLLLEHPALTRNYTVRDVLLAQDFLSLGLFPENMVRVLFSSDGLPILEEYFERSQSSLPLLMLYNAVKVLYPEYEGPMPPISMIEQWKEATRVACANKTYPLKTALQTGLGGESYVISGLYHEGLHIDHGILMRKGGYPVAVNSQSNSQSDCLSSIAKPAESIMILVKVFSQDVYANNTRRLRGGAALELKILENLGHPIVVVDLESWRHLPDHEKIPFLMQRIREKMEHLQWNQNWGDVIPP